MAVFFLSVYALTSALLVTVGIVNVIIRAIKAFGSVKAKAQDAEKTLARFLDLYSTLSLMAAFLFIAYIFTLPFVGSGELVVEWGRGMLSTVGITFLLYVALCPMWFWFRKQPAPQPA